MSMNPVVHFQLPASNTKRAATFYQRAFGWKNKQLGPDMGNYVLAQTTEVTKAGRTKAKGHINGGFFQKSKAAPHPCIVIAVPDIKKAAKKVKSGGGKLLGLTVEIPGVGLYAMFLDSEGNRAAMLQPFEM
jgi:predicted enzyme related to lactoylglutathione lyase